MQRSTQLTLAGILIIIGSCLALVSSLFSLDFLKNDYFISQPYFFPLFGADFYARVAIIGFELFAFIFGLVSAVQTLKGKRFNISVLGASFLLVAGLLFFIDFFPRVLYLSFMEFAFEGWWSFLQNYFGFPIIILSALGLIFLISKSRITQLREGRTLLAISGTTMILCSVVAIFLVVISYGLYEGEFSHPYGEFRIPLYTGMVNFCAFALALPIGILLLKKKHVRVLIALTVIVLILGLSLAFILQVQWGFVLGAFRSGLLFESPIIVLSAVALALAILGQRKCNPPTTKSVDTLVNASEHRNE